MIAEKHMTHKEIEEVATSHKQFSVSAEDAYLGKAVRRFDRNKCTLDKPCICCRRFLACNGIG